MLYQLSYVSNYFPSITILQLVERVAGIEPASSAWKAEVLPLNYTRQACRYRSISVVPRSIWLLPLSILLASLLFFSSVTALA